MLHRQSTNASLEDSRVRAGENRNNSLKFWTAVQSGREASIVFLHLLSTGAPTRLEIVSDYIASRCPAGYLDIAIAELSLALWPEHTAIFTNDPKCFLEIRPAAIASSANQAGLGRLLSKGRPGARLSTSVPPARRASCHTSAILSS